MPLYEYLCADCGHRFEFLQSLGAGTEGLSCPRCGETKLEKQLSTFAGQSSGGVGGRHDSGRTGGCGAGSGFT
ncbi:MAG: zinc ribbon domain-containing protein [Acidobacteriota bacterium]|nr:zinc ribbon domain-containing protein [Acidobacteriota bacterium]